MMQIIIFVFCLIPVLTACKQSSQAAEMAAPKIANNAVILSTENQKGETVELAKVEAAKPISVSLTGRLVWNEDRTVRIYPAFAGKVTQILVKAGDTVKAGQALALLASPDFGQAQSDTRRSAADHTVAQQNLARAKALYEHGVIAQKELQLAEAELQKTDAELHRTRARLDLYGGRDSVDQRFALSASISGVVVEKNVNPGQELRPDLMSSNAPAMFVISDSSHLWVQIDVSEKDLPFVEKGMVVPIRTSAYMDETFSTTIEAISDAVDPNTRTVKVRGSVANLARKLKGEMFVTAELPRSMTGALQVPTNAVYLIGGGNYVFVAGGDGRFVRREVKVGPSQNSVTTIRAGLQEGELVVIKGNLLLQQLLSDAR